MINSMTGYGRAQALIDGRDISVEIKSVNHRFFEFSARTPRVYGYLEEKLKSFIYKSVARGKVDVNVNIVTVEGTNTQVQINRALARSYFDELKALGKELSIHDDLSLSNFARMNDIFVVRKSEEDADAVWQGVSQVAKQALEQFLQMRALEGKQLHLDISPRLDAIERYVNEIEEQSPKTLEDYRTRLYNKMTEVLGDRQVDDGRILMEAAIFAEKTAVAEEITRLHSHIEQFRNFLETGSPIGRKMDFLVQELNREANTIGSKAQDIQVARCVVEVKSEIEKIREQIQNIE